MSTGVQDSLPLKGSKPYVRSTTELGSPVGYERRTTALVPLSVSVGERQGMALLKTIYTLYTFLNLFISHERNYITHTLLKCFPKRNSKASASEKENAARSLVSFGAMKMLKTFESARSARHQWARKRYRELREATSCSVRTAELLPSLANPLEHWVAGADAKFKVIAS